MNKHFARFCHTAALSAVLALSSSGIVHADGNSMMVPESGIIKVKSAYSKAETITRLKQDIAAKGIRFFDEIDRRSSPQTPVSRFVHRRCSSSAIRRLARCSYDRIRWLVSIGRSDC